MGSSIFRSQAGAREMSRSRARPGQVRRAMGCSYHVLLTAGPSRSKTSPAVNYPTSPRTAAVALLAIASLAAGCQSAPPEPQPDPSRAPARTENATRPASTTEGAGQAAQLQPKKPQKRKISAKPTAPVEV